MNFVQVVGNGWARADVNAATGEIEVEYPLGAEPWHVFARFKVEDGKLQIAELRVFPGPDRLGLHPKSERWPRLGKTADWIEAWELGTEVLRGIPIGDLRGTATHCYMGNKRVRKVSRQRICQDAIEATLHPGRAGRGDRYYAHWAARYVQLARSKHPIIDLAAEYELRPEQVRDLVHTARKRGLLGPGRNGLLTDKATSILLEED